MESPAKRLPKSGVSLVMPALLAALLLALGGCGGETGVRPGDTAGSGSLILEPSLIELTAGEGKARKREVTCRVVNRTGGPVTIRAVRTSCSCTMAGPLDRTALGPGESTDLRLSVSMPNYGRKETTVSLDVSPSGIAAPALRLVLTGPEPEVPHVEFYPEQLRLAGRRPGELVSQAVEVSAVEKAGSEPWVRGLSDPAGVVEVRREGAPVDEPRGETVLRTYRFEVRGRLPEVPGRPERFSLRIDAAPEATRGGSPVAIAGTTVLEPVARAVPEQLVIGRSELAGGPVVRRVLVVAEGGMTVDPPRDVPAWLSVRRADEAEPAGRVRAFNIEVSSPPPESEAAAMLRFGVRGDVTGAADLAVSLAP